jgi:transposase
VGGSNRWRIGHAASHYWLDERELCWLVRKGWTITAWLGNCERPWGMVGKWRARFLKARLEGLYDEPRPGAPRTVSDAQVEQVVVQTLESTPRGETHWSTRGLAKATGLSRMTISRIWHAFGWQPHRIDTFKLSPVHF